MAQNFVCPVCDKKVEGKQVRGFGFCSQHRQLAIQVRDILDNAKDMRSGVEFAKIVEKADTCLNPQFLGLFVNRILLNK